MPLRPIPRPTTLCGAHHRRLSGGGESQRAAHRRGGAIPRLGPEAGLERSASTPPRSLRAFGLSPSHVFQAGIPCRSNVSGPSPARQPPPPSPRESSAAFPAPPKGAGAHRAATKGAGFVRVPIRRERAHQVLSFFRRGSLCRCPTYLTTSTPSATSTATKDTRPRRLPQSRSKKRSTIHQYILRS